MLSTEEIEKAMKQIKLPVKDLFLHKAIMCGGKTEAHLSKKRVPNIISMGWLASDLFMIVTSMKVHVFGNANVADSWT